MPQKYTENLNGPCTPRRVAGVRQMKHGFTIASHDLSAPGFVTHADQRSSRRTEVVTVSEQIWGDDAAERSRHLGLANGAGGAALALAALAVAADHATEEGQAVLAASVSDPLARGVMLVTPAMTVDTTASVPQSGTVAA